MAKIEFIPGLSDFNIHFLSYLTTLTLELLLLNSCTLNSFISHQLYDSQPGLQLYYSFLHLSLIYRTGKTKLGCCCFFYLVCKTLTMESKTLVRIITLVFHIHCKLLKKLFIHSEASSLTHQIRGLH